VGIDIFMTILDRPDLSQRLDPTVASTAGTLVDVVPPHQRGNRDKIVRSYGDNQDQITQAAIGEIVDAGGLLEMPASVLPFRVRGSPSKHCGVRITKVMAPNLLIPDCTR
jgi:hypothetical protein